MWWSTWWMNICYVKYCSLNLFCISVYFAATLSSWNPWVMFTACCSLVCFFFSCLTWINHGVKRLETFHLQREKNLALACAISSLCFVFCQPMGRPAASCPHPNPSSPRSPPPPAQGASASTRYYVSYTLLHLLLPQSCDTGARARSSARITATPAVQTVQFGLLPGKVVFLGKVVNKALAWLFPWSCWCVLETIQRDQRRQLNHYFKKIIDGCGFL